MSVDATPSLLVIGECMMELSGQDNTFQRAFAGDTYNSAVYAKRRHEALDVQILTAVGSDPISEAMVAQWDRDRVGHELVMTSETAHPGIYAITTDESGERSFTYWRKASAATELMSLLTPEIRQAAAAFDCVFFSGITLAILSDADKRDLLEFLSSLQQQGSRIAFDPNYRAALWRDTEHAIEWLTEAYRLTNIALPGLADHTEIFGHVTENAVRTFLDAFEIDEVILKSGDEGIYGYAAGAPPVHQSITQAPNLKDTTGAGDSFAGTYLAERLTGASMAAALQSAADVASLVIQHPGAIVDEATYRAFLKRGA